jgi:peptidyl-prolyl cis-trans isomerase D
MFDFVRKHTKIMQFLLFLLIFPSFVLFGLEGYQPHARKRAVVATVNGTDILQPELDNAPQNTSRSHACRYAQPGREVI